MTLTEFKSLQRKFAKIGYQIEIKGPNLDDRYGFPILILDSKDYLEYKSTGKHPKDSSLFKENYTFILGILQGICLAKKIDYPEDSNYDSIYSSLKEENRIANSVD